ncbi:Chaperone protein dnaJ [Ceratocystis pirilliformis]|uniref:Chaperone protein dnaJ n=1 Tax=Ceratocystis pirilliformis TaxID=259994 RepID=A0ABR3YQ93_9PEZI
MSASGSDAKSTAGSSTARSREHNQGNQGRDVTPEQHASVQRIRKCSPTAFYDILGLEAVRTTATESDIKKAYRKQSLLTHPDKNGHEHADEAFKIVSRAFSVLSDKDKRATYDQYGTDPDNRFGGPPQNPFARGGGRPGFGGQQGHMFEGEITPEELFRQFFGGGGGGGGPFAGEPP